MFLIERDKFGKMRNGPGTEAPSEIDSPKVKCLSCGKYSPVVNDSAEGFYLRAVQISTGYRSFREAKDWRCLDCFPPPS